MPTGDDSVRSGSRDRKRDSRSRSRSYDSYDSYSDNYSDEFYSDEESSRGRTATAKKSDQMAGVQQTVGFNQTLPPLTRCAEGEQGVGLFTLFDGGLKNELPLLADPPLRHSSYKLLLGPGEGSWTWQQSAWKTRKPPAGKGGAAAKARALNKANRNAQSKNRPSQKDQDYVTRRVLSARRIKINELKNELEDVNQQVVELRIENKRLTRQQVMQDKALHKYEDTESDMPHIIARHNEQVRALTTQLRTQKEKTARAEKLHKDSADELIRTQRLLKKLKGLVEDKQLEDKDKLARRLTEVESELEDKDRRVKDLEKYVENLKKNHQHELGIERARHKESARRNKELENELDTLKHALKDKMRELDARNIYANRLKAGRNSSMNSTASSPAPLRAVPRSRKNSEPSTSVTPRDRAKQFEQQRKEQERGNREYWEQLPSRASKSMAKSGSASQSESQYYPATIDENYISSYPVGAQRNHRRSQSDRGQSTSTYQNKVDSIHSKPEYGGGHLQSKYEKWQTHPTKHAEEAPEDLSHSYSSDRMSRSVKYDKASKVPSSSSYIYTSYRERESRQSDVHSTSRERALSPSPHPPPQITTAEAMYQPGPPRESRRGNQPKTLDPKPEPDWFENIKNKRSKNLEEEEENDVDFREERERLKRQAEAEADAQRRREEMRREEERRQREEEEERRRREEDQRHRVEEERREEERRLKEEEERRRQELEEITRRAEEERERMENDKEIQERQRQRELLLAKMKAIDNASEPPSRYEPSSFFNSDSKNNSPSHKVASRREPNVYTFSQPIDNMHRGKPAYEPGHGTEPQRRTRGFFTDDNDSSSGYQPSFNINSAGKRNSKQITDTRADRTNSAKKNLMDQLFGSSSQNNKNRSSPLEVDIFNDQETQAVKTASRRTENQTGGLLFGEEASPSGNNMKLLPNRRHQPQTTFNTRPVINAVDAFDDDIEEVIL